VRVARPARTQAERKAETRRLLLEAAAGMFAREGFHAVSTDAVADAADRTSGSVYAHFGGKEGLLLALVEEMKDTVAEGILNEMQGSTSLDERISALWRGFALGNEHWILLEHELWLYAARNLDQSDGLAARYERERSLLAEELAVWTSGDDERPARELSVLTLALLLGLEMQRRIDPTAVPDDLAVDGLERLLRLPSSHSESRRTADTGKAQ
jgi:AcrR family transcriptional regulator